MADDAKPTKKAAKKEEPTAAEPETEPDGGVLSMRDDDQLLDPHKRLTTPTLVAQGPFAPTKAVEVLTQLSNILKFAKIPKKKVVATAHLLTVALELQSEWMWTRVLNGVEAMTAGDGFRALQAENIMISDQNRKERAEAMDALRRMGPSTPSQPQNKGP